jgi:DNA ligase N terminus
MQLSRDLVWFRSCYSNVGIAVWYPVFIVSAFHNLHKQMNSQYSLSFVSLLREISQIPPQKTTAIRLRTNDSHPAIKIFRRWNEQLRNDYSPLPPGSTSIIFRLLFPEEDACRKYGMQETKLCQLLAECLGVNAQNLEQWHSEGSSGCLGKELETVLENNCSVRRMFTHDKMQH